MRLEKIKKYLMSKDWDFQYTEHENLGSIEFEYRGVGYHIWEFKDGQYGAESNVRNGGSNEDFLGDYEDALIKVLNSWK